MKTYEWRPRYNTFVPGIAVTGGDVSDRRCRLHIAPIMLSPSQCEYEYHLKARLPALDAELAASFVNHARDRDFAALQLRLMRCDVEMRAECWLSPESDENDDTALILASVRYHARYAVADGAEILFETTFEQSNMRATGQVAVVRVPRGGRLLLQTTHLLTAFHSDPWYTFLSIRNDDGVLNEYSQRGRLTRTLAPAPARNPAG